MSEDLFAGDDAADPRADAAPEQPGRLSRDPDPPPGDDRDITGASWPDDDDPVLWPPPDDGPDPEEPGWGPPDDYPGPDESERAAWVAGMPQDVRADYWAEPYTGAGDVIQPGFTHRDPGGPTGVGFASGGALDTLGPGPWLARELADVCAPGHDQLGESELIGVLLAWQRQVAWSQAGLAAPVSALAARRRAQADRPCCSQLGEHVTDELAVALTLTRQSAARLLSEATGLDRLPEVAAALEAGAIDWARATLLIELLAVLSDEQARAVAARLLGRASGQTTGQLRAAAERAVLAADPDAAHRRQTQARKEIRVEVWHEPSGNAALAGRELPPAEAVAAEAALTADAQWLRESGAAGTLAELRAAAYLARLSGRDLASLLPDDDIPDGTASSSPGPHHPAASDGSGSGRARRGGSIHLTMPLAALAGHTDAPGEVAGYGTADAGTCRDLAARIGADPAARWCLTLTGTDGRAIGHACAGRRAPQAGQPVVSWAAGLRDKLHLLQTGGCRHVRQSPGYAWPASLRHLIEVRQRTCAAPGCRRPAPACDIDHTLAYDNGGPTCECNGAPLCRRHHRAKQAPGWHLTQAQPGVITWRLPSGRGYITTGDPYPV